MNSRCPICKTEEERDIPKYAADLAQMSGLISDDGAILVECIRCHARIMLGEALAAYDRRFSRDNLH